MAGETLTLGDVCTFCFLVVEFLVVIFFAWANSRDEFLVAGGRHGKDSENNVNPLFWFVPM